MHVIRRILPASFAVASLALTGLASVAPAQGWTLKTLYSFKGGSDGSYPMGNLVRDNATGDLYGTTYRGGQDTCDLNYHVPCGTVFKLARNGSKEILHSFTGEDGGRPQAGLIRDAAGNLYGTTPDGGGACNGGFGCGVVYKLAPDGTYTVLHSFEGGANDGAFSQARLTRDKSSGDLYGTAPQGGDLNCDLNGYGCGVVFKLAASGSLTLLHAFHGGSDGTAPGLGVALDSSGSVVGTTYDGGKGWGDVFKISPDGTKASLHTFNRRNVSQPSGEFLEDKLGNLYGSSFGSARHGTIFEITRDGKYELLHKFAKSGNYWEGGGPLGQLVRDRSGVIYGTEYFSAGIFQFQPDGTYELLHTFTGDEGSQLEGGLIADSHGNLYGMTADGGTYKQGTIYELKK
ncbi:MAG: choice-of-anchor tandem repeat GloVer-containing protein [Rhizomicrobium sp.]